MGEKQKPDSEFGAVQNRRLELAPQSNEHHEERADFKTAGVCVELQCRREREAPDCKRAQPACVVVAGLVKNQPQREVNQRSNPRNGA